MPSGSGLDAQLGLAAETTWGTAVTPTRFIEFLSESLSKSPEWTEGAGLRAGQRYKRASRSIQTRSSVSGDIEFEYASKGMGLLWKHALGAAITAPTALTAPAYEAIFTPGDFRNLGLTVQVGRPEPNSATVKPFTYTGCKVVSWEFKITEKDLPTLTLSFDGRDELRVTPLATPSYVTGSNVFPFSGGYLKLGGTAATATGKTTITGGVQATAIITELTISGETPMATERFGIGNAGLKAQQIENDIPSVTGSLKAEFNDTELYTPFLNGTPTPVEIGLIGGVIGASASNELISFTMPACKFKSASPQVGGPDILDMSTDFEAYFDDTNPVIQVRTVSSDTAL